MTFQTLTKKQDVTAVDSQMMSDMTINEYKEYLEFGLLKVDGNDILRSAPAGYPLATNKEQLKALLSYLKSIEHKIQN